MLSKLISKSIGALFASGFFFCLPFVSASAAPVIFCSTGGPNIDLALDGCISGTAGGYPNGGDGIYTNSNQDKIGPVEAAILAATGMQVELELYDKTGEGPQLTIFSDDNNVFDDNDPNGDLTGFWKTISGQEIDYITIKAANSFALYQVSPSASMGSFSTVGILNNGGQQPTVSHISFWIADGDDMEVSEPATLGLLGAGLALLGMRRRRA